MRLVIVLKNERHVQRVFKNKEKKPDCVKSATDTTNRLVQRFTNSTRRFLARPSSVLLSAIGFDSP